MRLKFVLPLLALTVLTAFPAAAQTPAAPTQSTPTAAPAPAASRCPAPAGVLPPADSGPLVCIVELRFEPVNESLIEPQTYLYYIQTQFSRPSDRVWVPFTEETERSLLEDFKRLWATNFLDNL